MGFRACVWDLDGTLLYTLPTIHHYCNQSLRHFGFHDITLDECRDLCRLSIAEFYHKLLKLGGCPPDRVAALQPAIRDYDCAAYLSDFTYLTQPYAGVCETLAELNRRGIPSRSLTGGYNGWLLAHLAGDTPDKSEAEKEEARLVRQKRIEDSIRRKFHVPLFSRFAKAVRDYELIQENDKIAVCISGGKDSMLMAKLFQELKRHNKFPFEVVYLVMDPGYNAANRKIIEENARMLGIPATIFETQIFDAVYNIDKSPCYLCARMRRGYLYRRAMDLGCNKIALGHHYDDVIETNLMGMLYGAQIQTMMPKLHSIHFDGMEVIRPMYLIREADIIHWRDYNDLHFIQCACRFTDTCTTCRPDGTSVSKRMEVKKMIAEMKKTNPYVEGNIFRSMENVNLDTVIGYKQHGVRHSFLEGYNEIR